MIDQMNHNQLTATGTPTFVTGALTVDPNQGAQLSGATNFFSATDSTSLSITGSMSVELFLKLASLPGATRDLVRKTGSYAVQVDTSGRVLFVVTGASSSVTVTSNTTLSTGVWYHLVCTYNGSYSGVQRFGKTDTGSSTAQVDDDNGSNKAVSKYTLVEPGILSSVSIALQYVDEVYPVQMCAVVYADSAGAPGALVTSSAVQTLNPPTPQWNVLTWITFPLASAVVPAGDYHLGYVADTLTAGLSSLPKAPLQIGRAVSGGTTSRRPDSVSGPSDPFGLFSTTGEQLSMYCDYGATNRTGKEGKALIYLNGALNVSSVYSGGIADTANALEICPAVTAQVDEVSIWNKALTDGQIATHYTAH